MADGVDDDTWLHHLEPHDYSRWVREAIKDGEVADELRRIGDHPARHPAATLGSRGDRTPIYEGCVRALEIAERYPPTFPFASGLNWPSTPRGERAAA